MAGFAAASLVAAWASVAGGAVGQAQRGAQDPASATYAVFVQSRQIGQETVAVIRQPDGWVIRGTNRLAAPLDITTRSAEIRYDLQWRPLRVQVDNITRGQQVALQVTFANGEATTDVTVSGQSSSATAKVSPDAVVLLNTFVGSYAGLAQRLAGRAAGEVLRGFIAPQTEIELTIQTVSDERIETPRRVILARRYTLTASAPEPLGDLTVHIWTEGDGALLRLSVPAQALELARDDIASAAARTTAFALPDDESVRIPASGFGLAASVTKPRGAVAPLPALILVGPSSSLDRDGVIAGIPVIGQLAGGLVEAGFFVVRFDRRGVGQTGGRSETATLADYAEDVRAIVTWLEKSRKDVDKRRIGVIGHGDGAWVAMQAAARDRRIAALAVMSAASGTGSEIVLEQQRLLLDRLKTPDAERAAKIALQQQINAAALKGGASWDGVPDEARRAADNAYFQSFLTFDVARVMRDIRQPVLIVHGALDRQVPVPHAEQLAALARARRRKVAVDVTTVPGVNHLLVPAVSGNVEEYATLPDRTVAPAAIAAVSTWMARELK